VMGHRMARALRYRSHRTGAGPAEPWWSLARIRGRADEHGADRGRAVGGRTSLCRQLRHDRRVSVWNGRAGDDARDTGGRDIAEVDGCKRDGLGDRQPVMDRNGDTLRAWRPRRRQHAGHRRMSRLDDTAPNDLTLAIRGGI